MRIPYAPPVSLILALATASCVAEAEPDEEFEFRCLSGMASGLIGLDLVDIGGTPDISGTYANVFSNTKVALAGNFTLDGSAISGGSVTIAGTRLPGSSIIENATGITVSDPSAHVTAHKTNNDNAKIPCITKGNKCTSPVVAGVLTLASQQSLTLRSGNYYFTGVSMSGQSELTVDGTATIYLDGGATFNGGSSCHGGGSLTVISSSSSEIKLNGGGSTAMQIYAPKATVRFAGTQGFRGSALGKQLIISGTADLTVVSDIAGGGGYVACPPDGPSNTPPHGGQ